MTDDELERRKEETWGMSEIRGDSLAQEEAEIISSEKDASDESDTTDTAEMKATAEADVASDIAASRNTESVSDTADTPQSKNTADTEDVSDTPDSEDQKETSDTSDPNGGSTSKEQTKGNTVREMALDAEAKGLAVRDLHNVNVYLYEDIHQEMVSTFKALDAEYYQTYGEDLSKNKDFFNAVFRAGLSSPRLREELELEE